MSKAAPTTFGALLRRCRLAAGLTQAALAERAGLSERAVNDLERDPQRTPRLETVALLASALDLSPAERARLLAAARPESPSPEQPSVAEASTAFGRHERIAVDDAGGATSTTSRAAYSAAPLSPSASLPEPPTPFVGRAREVSEICALLRESRVRLLTLTGPGGIGKTRLALEVAARLASEYADGVRFVNLESLTDPAQMPPTIASALNLPEAAHLSDWQRLTDGLSARNLLLVLDNFEQLTSTAVEIERLLVACPALTLLITSRAMLRLAREHVYVVPPLAVPDRGNVPAPQDLLAYDSVALLMQRARAVKPEFTLTEANADAVAGICVRLEGAPLAIQLAAARINHLTPEALLARLDQQLATLTGGPQDAPERQRTVRATLDWSYQLLTSPQQTLLRRLAVFAGGWTLEAAEAICDGGAVSSADVLDLLGQLVDQSLVVVDEQGGAARYRLLETIRQYAEEKLRESGEEIAQRDRHLAWYLQLADSVGMHRWWMMVPWSQIERQHAEQGNFRAALAWSRRDTSGQTELRLAGALAGLWSSSGAVSEGRRVLHDAIRRADPTTRSTARAKALMTAAALAGMQTDPAGSVGLAEEAIGIFRELGDEYNLVRALMLAARLRNWVGDAAGSEAAWDERLRVCRDAGDSRALAEALWYRADLALERGDYQEARRRLEECVMVCRRVNDPLIRAQPLISLARVACAEGNIVHARELAQEGLALRRDGAPAWLVAIALNSLGEVERCAGNDDVAEPLFAEALATFREQGDQAGVAWSLHDLGHMALRAGDAVRAAELFAEALAARYQHGYANGVATELAGLAGVRCAAGDYVQAARLCGAAEALLERIQSVLAPADSLDYQRIAATVRANMEASALDAAWAAGRACPLPDIVIEALHRP